MLCAKSYHTMHKVAQYLADLEPRKLYRLMRNAMRRAGARVRREAAKEMGHDIKLRGGKARLLRVVVSRRLDTLVVSAWPKRDAKHMYRNRYGQLKPVPFWASVGTAERHTRKGWDRGRLPKKDFMERAEKATIPEVERILYNEVNKLVEKACS